MDEEKDYNIWFWGSRIRFELLDPWILSRMVGNAGIFGLRMLLASYFMLSDIHRVLSFSYESVLWISDGFCLMVSEEVYVSVFYVTYVDV